MNENAIAQQEKIIFEINNEDIFDTALATCQHSIVP